MTAPSDDRGSVAVTTCVLLPLLLVVVVCLLQIGVLRVAAGRVRAAADLATVVAVNDQDDAELARAGRLRLSSDAEEVCRDFFARELELSAPLLGAPASEIARSAEIAVFAVAPAHDPRTGRRYEHPAVRIAARVPVRTPIFGALGLRGTTEIGVLSVSSPR